MTFPDFDVGASSMLRVILFSTISVARRARLAHIPKAPAKKYPTTSDIPEIAVMMIPRITIIRIGENLKGGLRSLVIEEGLATQDAPPSTDFAQQEDSAR